MLLGDYEKLTLLQLILQHPGIFLHELQERLVHRLLCESECVYNLQDPEVYGMHDTSYCHTEIKFIESEVYGCMYEPSMFVWTDDCGCDRRDCARKLETA